MLNGNLQNVRWESLQKVNLVRNLFLKLKQVFESQCTVPKQMSRLHWVRISLLWGSESSLVTDSTVSTRLWVRSHTIKVNKIKVKEISIYFTRLKKSVRKHWVHKYFSALKAAYSSFKIFIYSSFPFYLGFSFHGRSPNCSRLIEFSFTESIFKWDAVLEERRHTLPASIFSLWHDRQGHGDPQERWLWCLLLLFQSEGMLCLGSTLASPGRTLHCKTQKAMCPFSSFLEYQNYVRIFSLKLAQWWLISVKVTMAEEPPTGLTA